MEIKFINHFKTRLVTTHNYSAIANFSTLQIITAQAKSFQGFTVNQFVLAPSPFRITKINFFQLNPCGQVKVNVKVTLQLAVYRQSVRLGVNPLRTTTRDFFN
jgi:hypothetical protein